MMTVLTDDVTGASELAGIALSKGFSVTVQTRSVSAVKSDILIVATDMRSLSEEEARKKSAKVTKALMELKPKMIFKKVDSVLRGHIGPELESQMQASGIQTALLLPANPTRGRTIEDSIYYINSVPISDTAFATESSDVTEILSKRGAGNVVCLSASDYKNAKHKPTGIVIGNCKSDKDLKKWARLVDKSVVPAGAADFFSVLLDSQFTHNYKRTEYTAQGPSSGNYLYVCGSQFPSSQNAVKQALANGHAVFTMPDELYFNRGQRNEVIQDWVESIIEAYETNSKVILASLQNGQDLPGLSGQEVSQIMADAVSLVSQRVPIDEILIEGGATSQAILNALGINQLIPTQSFATGTTRMRVDTTNQMHVTLKPGSYLWPQSIWTFNMANQTQKNHKRERL